jgi:hypothetical protein
MSDSRKDGTTSNGNTTDTDMMDSLWNEGGTTSNGNTTDMDIIMASFCKAQRSVVAARKKLKECEQTLDYWVRRVEEQKVKVSLIPASS